MACLWLATAGCAPRLVVLPIRSTEQPAAETERALAARGTELRPELFAPNGTLQLPDTILTGDVLDRFLTGDVEGFPRYERFAYEPAVLYLCPDGAVQVGRYTAYQNLPGASTPLPVVGRWWARWGRRGSEWEIESAALRPPWLRTTRLGVDPACVGPTETAMARRPTAVSVHWGGLWSHGGPAAGMEAELRYAGWRESSTRRATWTIGASRRLVGGWGARVLVGQRQAATRATPPGENAVGLRSSSGIAALLAMHERWLIRVAAGPALAHVEWEWSGPDGPASSAWSVGWVNELALAIPVGETVFLDLGYHDWLFGDASPPEHLGVASPAQRLRGSSVSLGVGRRF